jgi:hypothetical protein
VCIAPPSGRSAANHICESESELPRSARARPWQGLGCSAICPALRWTVQRHVSRTQGTQSDSGVLPTTYPAGAVNPDVRRARPVTSSSPRTAARDEEGRHAGRCSGASRAAAANGLTADSARYTLAKARRQRLESFQVCESEAPNVRRARTGSSLDAGSGGARSVRSIRQRTHQVHREPSSQDTTGVSAIPRTVAGWCTRGRVGVGLVDFASGRCDVQGTGTNRAGVQLTLGSERPLTP